MFWCFGGLVFWCSDVLVGKILLVMDNLGERRVIRRDELSFRRETLFSGEFVVGRTDHPFIIL